MKVEPHMKIDQAKLEQFAGKMITDLGAAAVGALVIMGDRLGFYRALSELGATTPEALAKATGTSARYAREWLSCQAASGYVDYDPSAKTFTLSPEQAAVLAEPESPVFMAGGFSAVASLYADEPKISEACRKGVGVSWHDHSTCLFCGTERFFGPGYRANLVQTWLPALDGVVDKLKRGARAADIGCGHGVSTIVMAQAFPKSQFYGFDFHEASIMRARELAAESGVENVEFHVADARRFKGDGYDLVAMFDCLHDMGDPVGAANHVRDVLGADGTWMIIEPKAGDLLEENLNPIGRVFYAFSTMVCVPASLSQDVGAALGAQAGEKKLREVITAGGFTRIKRAAETPTNIVLEARL